MRHRTAPDYDGSRNEKSTLALLTIENFTEAEGEAWPSRPLRPDPSIQAAAGVFRLITGRGKFKAGS
jgi:hypothetical protein